MRCRTTSAPRVFSGGMVRYRAYSTKGLTRRRGRRCWWRSAPTPSPSARCLLLGVAAGRYDPHIMQRRLRLLPDRSPSKRRRDDRPGCSAFVRALRRRLADAVQAVQLRHVRAGLSAARTSWCASILRGAAGADRRGGHHLFRAAGAGKSRLSSWCSGAFLLSFSAALVSHAPGGLGVFELVFVICMPDVPRLQVLAALLVLRLFYLIIPLLMALVVVALFERRKLVENARGGGRGRGAAACVRCGDSPKAPAPSLRA